MEVEFRTNSKGEVYYEDRGGVSHRLTKFSTEIVSQVIAVIKERYPNSFARLAQLYAKANPTERQYLMADKKCENSLTIILMICQNLLTRNLKVTDNEVEF